MPDRPGSEPKGSDEILRAELKKVYLARARLFVSKIRERRRGVGELIDFLSREKSPHFEPDSLGVTQSALRKLNAAGVPPHQVFCHPDILAKKPKVIDYYRTLAPLSRKGLTQIIEGLTGEARINAQCETIYLASCFTKAVVEQIEADAQVRNRFNLIDIMEDDAKRKEFLDELFVHLIRIVRA